MAAHAVDTTSSVPPAAPALPPSKQQKTYRMSAIFPFVKSELSFDFFARLGIGFSQYQGWDKQYRHNSVCVGLKALSTVMAKGTNVDGIIRTLKALRKFNESEQLEHAHQTNGSQFYLETSSSYLNPSNQQAPQEQQINPDSIFQYFTGEQNNWCLLGIHLDISVDELLNYEDEERGNCEFCLQKVLKTACQAHARFSDLHQALNIINKHDAENFLQAFQGNEQDFYLTEPSASSHIFAMDKATTEQQIKILLAENKSLKKSVAELSKVVAQLKTEQSSLNERVKLLEKAVG
ncbi:death domain-containing protein [Parashewanella tropica]|uniref:death domain-containing protein n=1 Tax=Parashewanella tropica TaxID=2547970 RepID=UPI00105A5A28|nr:death domain-containing protein [Parashewanella tropica]